MCNVHDHFRLPRSECREQGLNPDPIHYRNIGYTGLAHLGRICYLVWKDDLEVGKVVVARGWLWQDVGRLPLHTGPYSRCLVSHRGRGPKTHEGSIRIGG